MTSIPPFGWQNGPNSLTPTSAEELEASGLHYAQAVLGQPLGLPGALAATRYVGGTVSGAPASGTFAVGDFVIDQSGQVWVCTTAGSPGSWTKPSGGLVAANNLSDVADAGSSRLNLHIAELAVCQVAVTANVTLSGLQTIDGYTTLAGDLVLCTGQTTASQNGPWLAASGAWTRPHEYASGASIVAGRTASVVNGTVNGKSRWLLTTAGTVVVDTTATTWVNQAGSGASGTLAGDSDVAISSPSDKQGLLYDAASGKWKNQNTAQLAQSGQTPAQEPVADQGAATGNVGSLAQAARADHIHPSGGLVYLLWGNGSDGAAVLDGTNTFASTFITKSGNVYTLQRSAFFTNLTVNSGITLLTNNCIVSVNGTLQNNGNINNNGLSATGATRQVTTNRTFWPGGNGANGATGVGAAGSQPTQPGNYGFGGGGGAGGSGTSGAGGAGANPLNVPANGDLTLSNPLSGLLGLIYGAGTQGSASVLSGGSGGGAGAGDGTNSGGAGGEGGGVLLVRARIITGSGSFTANGGAGGTPTGGNCGGGGGGGNGLVIVNYFALSTWTGTLTATGGAGGSATGTGVAGTAGQNTSGNSGLPSTYLDQWL